MKMSSIDELLDCVEKHFETLSFSNLTFSDIGKLFFEFLETILVIVTFFLFLVYVLFSSKSPTIFLAFVATYVALMTLIVTSVDIRERLLEEVELLHNIEKIRGLYPDAETFDREYPLLKSLIMIKQKHPEIDLCQLHKLDKSLFTVETLLGFLYGGKLRKYTKISSKKDHLDEKRKREISDLLDRKVYKLRSHCIEKTQFIESN